ncbi:MAG: phosphoheptose isomerase [Bacteroidota bacterium]
MDQIFEKVERLLIAKGFRFERKDFNRPWGGFFVIEEAQAPEFTRQYFPDLPDSDLIEGRKVSPKILLVAPDKRLSWQYHFRRSEVWRVVDGKVGVVRSLTDDEMPLKTYQEGDTIVLEQGERHRLVGLNEWGMVAEIWQHTNPDHPSDEDDIVRLQDDFGRSTPVSQKQ